MCTVRVFVSSHLLQEHVYGVLHSLILFLEDPYTEVCGTSACHRQKGSERDEKRSTRWEYPECLQNREGCSNFVDGECRKLKHGFSELHRHKL